MKLSRSGARRNHGASEVLNKEVKAPRFDAKTSRIKLNARDRDPVNGSTYDYELDLSLDEIGSIIEVLDRLPQDQRRVLAAALGSRTRALLRLAHVAAGVPVQDDQAV